MQCRKRFIFVTTLILFSMGAAYGQDASHSSPSPAGSTATPRSGTMDHGGAMMHRDANAMEPHDKGAKTSKKMSHKKDTTGTNPATSTTAGR